MCIRKTLTFCKSSSLARLVKCEPSIITNFGYRRSLLRPAPIIDFNVFVNAYQIRSYSKDKPKKQGKKKIEIREDLLAEYFNVEKLKHEMKDVIEYMQNQFQQHVSLRSVVGAIENITIDYEGVEYTIQNLAQVNRRNPKVVALNFSAFPQTIPTVLQALQESGMNLNPQQDGTSLFIPVPKITREHREKLAKNANAIFVKCKTAIKEVEMKYNRKLEMKGLDSPISAEKSRIIHEQLRELAINYVHQLEEIKNTKVAELLKEDEG